MAMKKQYRSAVMASIHETAKGLHNASAMDKQTMRKFDAACLTPVHPLSAEVSLRICSNAARLSASIGASKIASIGMGGRKSSAATSTGNRGPSPPGHSDWRHSLPMARALV